MSEAPRVRRLPNALVDQIAAGEVVERPASVVKELVENALDAGAERVRVEVRDGGRAWIAVADDGRGMTPEDARLALERHATSKISSVDDLQRIATYGFRGEALPAIASVSTLRLRTRTADAPAAHEIRVRAGVIEEEREAGAPPGTRIEVADLFAAVPARRKFLKTANTEWGHVADWLARAALALPTVHFDVQRDDRPALSWPAATSDLDRVAAVLGEHEAEVLVPVRHEEGRARVEGFVSRPDHHRGSPSGVYLFVNRRPVRDRVLQHALVETARDWLPRGRFPTAVLFVSVPEAAVDVNVHPAKWEVRFADPRWAHQLVRRAVRTAVEARAWTGMSGGPIAGIPIGATPAAEGLPPGSRPRSAADAGGATRPGTTDWIFATQASSGAARDDRVADAPETAPVRFAEQRRLGQLLATYLVLETKEGLLLVDQHAAHERVLYERLRAEWLSRAVERQGLLAPLAIELAPRPLAALIEGSETALRLGFELEAFGDDAVAVRSVPALLGNLDPAALVRALADELAAGTSGAQAALRALAPADRVFATLACHASRRKGDVLDPREQEALLEALDAIPWAPTCPHGRPVAVPLALAEIERRFGRR